MRNEKTTELWIEQVRNAWDERAGMFDEMSTANSRADDRKTELDSVSGTLGLQPGARVLDAGCGAGHFAIAFAERGCSVAGIDLSPELIARARKNSAEAGVEIELSVGHLRPLNAPDDAYDAIVSRMVLQFVPDLSAVLDEFGRVAAPTGRLWLAVPGALSPIYRHSWKRFLADEPEPMNYVTPWELIRLLEEKDWVVDQQWGSFDTIGDAGNTAAELDIATLPLPLQQAAATVWNVIARRS